MQILKINTIILCLLSILACNNTSNKTAETDDDSATTTKKMESREAAQSDLDLTKYGIANNPDNVLGGLKVEEQAPDFNLPDQDGQAVSLSTTLSKGPVLLVFLRAEWCSFCVRHLLEFQENIQKLHGTSELNVIAISPQKQSYLQAFHKENNLSFPILYDEDHSVMKDYKVFFHVTDKYNDYIEKSKGKRIEVFNGDTEAVMPIPATYLIDQNKVIEYVHYDPDYKKRSDLKEVMAQL